MNTKPTIDDLEILTPDELGKLLHAEVNKKSSDIKYMEDLGALSITVNREPSDIKYIQDLLYVGCPINYRSTDGLTALHMAAMYGKLEVVEFLVSKGAQVDIMDKHGWMPLYYASLGKQPIVLKYLLSKMGKL